MDNKYVVKKEYRVYIISDTNGHLGQSIKFSYTGNSFAERNYAEEWINDEGVLQFDYTIVEVFTKGHKKSSYNFEDQGETIAVI